MKADYPYVMHMLEAIEEIETYGISSETKFLLDHKTKKATVKNLEIIGEAAKRVSKKARNLAPGIPWQDIIGTRNKLIHEYISIDYRLVWKISQENLPKLKDELKQLLLLIDHP